MDMGKKNAMDLVLNEVIAGLGKLRTSEKVQPPANLF
jgi:hypothetical protein